MAAPISVEQIVEYYKNLLIIQFKSKPKAAATIALIAEIQAVNNLPFDVESAFDIETAVGVQLDILGKWIGVTRDYVGTEYPDNTFGFLPYFGTEQGQEGFAQYSDYTTKVGTTLSYAEIIGNGQKLNDDQYRIVLKLKIICNAIDMSQSSIDSAMNTVFGDQVILSTANNMAITYFVANELGVLGAVLLEKQVLPKPMAVRVNIIDTEMGNPFFAFATYSDSIPNLEADGLIQGFSTYSNYDTLAGQVLEYSDLS